ncbi:MAG: hypothetical protein JWM78_2593 [Verrucomicrobiaceae bacterium]|nr:hypothetical protein [Verrucomicrobiaceae bacterium]
MLTGCGGDSHGPWSGNDNNVAPGTVVGLAGNAGDGAISLGWSPPITGDAPFSYTVQVTPASNGAQITQSETSVIVRGLVNATNYSISVRATNQVGAGTIATLQLTPKALTATYSTVNVIGNNTGSAASGIADPTLLRLANGNIWMVYSSVNYYGSPVTQDKSTSLALSSDGGATFNYMRTLGAATNASVTGTTGNVCAGTTCNGRWVYEAPFVVDDANDPNASRRFKVFAHKYFLYPSANPSAIYTLGAIVMWAAPALDATTWSAEQSVLGWNSTPPELTPNRIVNTINPALNECLTIREGSASSFKGALDFVFACDNGSTQKIVQLRSTDHANTFSYVGTLLEAADAAPFNANYFGAPALVTTETNAQLLLATPAVNRTVNGASTSNAYSGCVVFPIESEQNATLFRSGATPLSILQIPALTDQLNGGCAWERGITGVGILMNERTANPVNFSVVNTQINF